MKRLAQFILSACMSLALIGATGTLLTGCAADTLSGPSIEAYSDTGGGGSEHNEPREGKNGGGGSEHNEPRDGKNSGSSDILSKTDGGGSEHNEPRD